MDELQDRLVRLALGVLDEYGFALAGGYALQAHGLVERMSEDVDLFTDRWDSTEFSRAVDSVVDAYRRAGLDVAVVRRAETFARLQAVDPGSARVGSVDLAADRRASDLVLTGMRPAELCGLRVRSIDFVRSLVSIRETLLPVSAYADRRLELVSGPPKTEAGDRTIPIPSWLCDQLAQMLAARAAQRGIPVELVAHLFVNRAGKSLNRDKFRETVIRPALIAAGLPPSTRTYDLRHAHASMLIDLGANVLAVAQRMGHSDASVTLREYCHLFAGVQERLSEQLEELRAQSSRTTPGDLVPLAIEDVAGRTQDAPGRKKAVKRGSQRSSTRPEKWPLTSGNVD
jgi:integrase